jgi:hypothetical protein
MFRFGHRRFFQPFSSHCSEAILPFGAVEPQIPATHEDQPEISTAMSLQWKHVRMASLFHLPTASVV